MFPILPCNPHHHSLDCGLPADNIAGEPTTIVYGGTALVTTAPAPTTDPVPTETPGSNMALWPIQTSGPMETRCCFRHANISGSSSPYGGIDSGR
jgi:hypothetical protein